MARISEEMLFDVLCFLIGYNVILVLLVSGSRWPCGKINDTGKERSSAIRNHSFNYCGVYCWN